VAGVYFASQLRFAYPASERIPWSEALAINFAYYWAWGALVPVVLACARRLPLAGPGWPRSALAHLLLAALLTCVEILVAASALGFILIGSVHAEYLARALRLNFHSSYPTYFVILFAYLSFDYYTKYQDRALHAARLEAHLADARLTALRMQLNPHFLFNTLNSISSLMYTDVAAADTMMTRLSELLRTSLDGDGQPEVTLRQELDLLRRYVDIEKVRFEERLRVTIDVEDAALDAHVPAFALQPLVENAIRHAIAPRAEGGRLALVAQRVDGTLRISVTDDGPGLPAVRAREGVGLANTRARLAQLYGAEQSLELENLPGGGLRVALTIPFRTAR
jgi:sensor histidine kinase YesM